MPSLTKTIRHTLAMQLRPEDRPHKPRVHQAMDLATFLALTAMCAPNVDSHTAQALVAVESSFNVHAIGVVGGALERQPRTRAEVLATARALHAGGWNFSVGLGQINHRNFERLGLNIESAFEPCDNLAAMQAVLMECYDRARRQGTTPQPSIRQALSCYYSGNFSTGFQHGYVHRVLRAFHSPATGPTTRSVQAMEAQ